MKSLELLARFAALRRGDPMAIPPGREYAVNVASVRQLATRLLAIHLRSSMVSTPMAARASSKSRR